MFVGPAAVVRRRLVAVASEFDSALPAEAAGAAFFRQTRDRRGERG